MTKVDLAEYIQQRLDCPKKEALELVDEVIELLKDGIVREGSVKISGFGVFNLRRKDARRGRNPVTGEDLTIDPRTVLTFKPSHVLKGLVNKGE